MLRRDERGFTLVELLIVLIILALLVAIVIPAISGFLGRGRQESFNGDRRNLQAAVDAYYTDSAEKQTIGGVGYNTFPSKYNADGAWGVVTRDTDVIIAMTWLKSKGYIRDIAASAAIVNGGTTGHYVWIIDGATGTVYGCAGGTPDTANGGFWYPGSGYTTNCGYDGQYP